MPTLPEFLNDYRQSHAEVQRQTAERAAIMLSPEYVNLKAKLDALTAHIPDSSEELALDREALLKALNAEGITELEGYEVKTRKQREVDTMAVLRAFDGDLDALMSLVSIKQTSLENWIESNPQDKRTLRACIVEKGIKVVDVIPSEV